MIAIILLPVFIFILLNIPFVQNFIADKFANRISKKINSDVSIDNIQFNIFRGLVAKDFKVIDTDSRDTILNAGQFSVGLKQNIAFVFTNELRLNDIRLEDFNLKLITEKGDSTSNFEQILTKLITDDKDKDKKDKKPLALELDEIDIRNFDISIVNENKSTYNNFGFSNFSISIDSIDLEQQYFVISKLFIKRPNVLLNTLSSEKGNTDGEINYNEETQEDDLLISKDVIPFNFKIIDLEIEDGIVSSNTVTAEPEVSSNKFNPKSFTFDGIQFQADSIVFIDTIGFNMKIVNCAANNAEGFSLASFNTDLSLTNRKAVLKNLNIKTDHSSINDEISLSFRKKSDLSDFSNRVFILANFNNSNIAFRELNYYFPDIRNVSFFSRNTNRVLFLDGKLKGKLNNLSGRNISLRLDDQLILKGRFDTRDITDPDNTLVNLEVESLNTNINSLKKIIPDFKPPENFDKLGNISFSGRFDGFYYDFVAFGELNSSVGKADLDMRLDVKEGRDNANYSGTMNLHSFDLATWTDNQDFGKVTLQSQVNDGQGLKRSNAFADLSAEIVSFEFKDYVYENVVFSGQIDQSRLNGDLKIKNDDVDFDFVGELVLTDSLYLTDFNASINELDLAALNLVKEPLSIRGNIVSNIEGSGMQDFIGEAELGDFNIFYKDTSYSFDTLYINSSPDGLDKRNANVISEFFSVSINGSFDLEKLPDFFSYQLHKSYPFYARKLKVKKVTALERGQEFDLKIRVEDSRNYFDLAGLDGFRIKDLKFNAAIDSDEEYIFIEADVDTIIRNTDQFTEATIDLLNRESTNKIKVALKEVKLSDRVLQPISVEVDMNKDDLIFGINTRNIADSVEVLNLRGTVEPLANNFKIHFDDAQWVMFSSEWNFSKKNQVILGDKFIDIQNMSMTDGYRLIVLDDIDNNQGLSLSMRNFDFKLIDALIDYDKISFTGEGDIHVNAKQLFDKVNLDGNLLIPELMLNDVSYGETVLDFHTSDNTVVAAASIINDLHNIKVLGSYNTKEKYLDANLKGNGFQMKFFQDFIIGDGISQTQGYANVFADVVGPLNDIKITGEAELYDGGVKINYLGNFIRFDKQKLSITEKFIGFDGFEIIDVEGNIGVFQGGLHHDLLADFTIEVDATGDRFVGLNTTKSDNPLYHGYGVGDMDIKFRGPFHSTDIKVNATTGRETVLNIPITYYQEGYENSFITFVDSTSHELTEDGFVAYIPEEFKIEGVDVELNLQLTDEAEVNIIFNEQLNDIIKGRGEGNLRVLLKRSGDFDIFGDYFVSEGEYLFTAWGVIAKPFIVKRGGTITWTGDPINAELDIDASYEGLRAPLNIFLSELLTSASLETQDIAKEKTDVDLNLHLGGSLFEPIVSFDLNFPNVTGELRSYTTSKINTLRQNESEMNNQVVGLLIFNSFLPTASTINSDIYSTNSVISTGYNTLSEMVSNQISFLLSGFLQEALEENGFISGIDFDIGFSKNSSLYGFQSESNNLAPDEIEVNLKNKFFDDRWELNLGGNFVRERAFAQGTVSNNYLIGDFALAYYLTEDKKLKLRVYGKYDLDIFENREQKYGFGLSYRREFGSLFEIQDAIKADTKKIFQPEGTQ